MEVIEILATVGFSIIFLGIGAQVYRKCTKPTMKESRSDNDLSSLNQDEV